jgi:polar amino acid transport system substrate-binding protein
LVLNAAIESGSYQEVIDRWALDAEAVDESEINPEGLPRP